MIPSKPFGASYQPLWNRAADPIEISSLVTFLLSKEASIISRSLNVADGLWSLSGGGSRRRRRW
jgi:hypothetical protein